MKVLVVMMWVACPVAVWAVLSLASARAGGLFRRRRLKLPLPPTRHERRVRLDVWG